MSILASDRENIGLAYTVEVHKKGRQTTYGGGLLFNLYMLSSLCAAAQETKIMIQSREHLVYDFKVGYCQAPSVLASVLPTIIWFPKCFHVCCCYY